MIIASDFVRINVYLPLDIVGIFVVFVWRVVRIYVKNNYEFVVFL